jgi:hypothetical protein
MLWSSEKSIALTGHLTLAVQPIAHTPTGLKIMYRCTITVLLSNKGKDICR